MAQTKAVTDRHAIRCVDLVKKSTKVRASLVALTALSISTRRAQSLENKYVNANFQCFVWSLPLEGQATGRHITLAATRDTHTYIHDPNFVRKNPCLSTQTFWH